MRSCRSLSLFAATLATVVGVSLTWGGAQRAEAAVYWGNGGFIGAANLDGSNFVDGLPYGLANVPEIGDVCGVAVSGGNLYWADRSRGTIGRMGLGSNPTGRVDFVYEKVEIDEAFVSGLVHPCGVAVDGAHVYWASWGSAAIGRANLDGSAPDRTFISGVSSPCGVAVDGAHLYWGSFLGNSVGRAGLDGGEVEEGFVEGASGPCGVAVDGARVYWANWDGSTIGRAGIDGSAPDHDFIAGLDSPCGVAVDGSHVYWANWGARDPVGRANLDGSGVVNSLVTTDFYLGSCGVALDARSFAPPPPPPSAPFFLGKLRRVERIGAAFLTIKVPATGGEVGVQANGLRWKLLGPSSEGGYLVWQLKLWPGRAGKAAARIRSQLRQKGRTRAHVLVTYQEAGKSAVSRSRSVTLIRRRR